MYYFLFHVRLSDHGRQHLDSPLHWRHHHRTTEHIAYKCVYVCIWVRVCAFVCMYVSSIFGVNICIVCHTSYVCRCAFTKHVCMYVCMVLKNGWLPHQVLTLKRYWPPLPGTRRASSLLPWVWISARESPFLSDLEIRYPRRRRTPAAEWKVKCCWRGPPGLSPLHTHIQYIHSVQCIHTYMQFKHEEWYKWWLNVYASISPISIMRVWIYHIHTYIHTYIHT